MQKKSFIAGMVTMALLFGLVGSAYAAHQKQATLNYNDIQIRLNGNLVEPKDAKGNVVEPFIIDGTTYLPVRAIGEALGMQVDWLKESNTVQLISHNTARGSAYDALCGWLVLNGTETENMHSGTHRVYADVGSDGTKREISLDTYDSTGASSITVKNTATRNGVTAVTEISFRASPNTTVALTLLYSYYKDDSWFSRGTPNFHGLSTLIWADEVSDKMDFSFYSFDGGSNQLSLHEDMAKSAMLDNLRFLDFVLRQLVGGYDITAFDFSLEGIYGNT